MVTRKSRIVKEKKLFSSFGQLMLPLALIMAVALLFFSVRLFFSGPSPDVTAGIPASTSGSGSLSGSGAKAGAVKETRKKSGAEVLLARPADGTKPSDAPQKNKPDAEAFQKPAPAKSEGGGSVVRWDLQIGAFSSASNAGALAKRAKADGFVTYTAETVTAQGKKVFAVRVTGAPTRGEAESVAKKLKSKSYEYFLVKVSK